jgi:HEAT repeat protein
MPKVNIPFETLIDDLHGPDWTKRCDAARMLGQSKDPRAVDALLPDLQDPDWRVRRNAAQALGALKSARAIDGLIEALKDRTATVRERAAVGLGRIKDPRAIPALVEAIIEQKDAAHFHVNEGAYQAIRKFGRKAGPALMDALQTKQNIYLVELLADSKHDVPVDFFLTLAGSNDPAMQRTALNALAKFNEPRVIEFLMALLSSAGHEEQVLAVRTLGQLRAVEAAPKLLDLLQGDQIMGPQAALCRAISDAFQEFSGIKQDVANAFPMKSKLAFNVGGAGTSLAEMMGMLGNEGFQKLNRILTDAESRASELGGRLNLPPEVIESMSAQTWKFGAMLADGRDAKTEQVKLLIGLLESDAPLTRTAAALSLPWYMDSQVFEPLEHCMHDADEMVRRASTWAYGVLKNMFPFQ